VIDQELDDLCTHYWFFDEKIYSIQISIEVVSSMHEAMSALHSYLLLVANLLGFKNNILIV